MNRPIDLPRARQALAHLDELAREHPRLTQGGDPWSAHLDQLEDLTMPTSSRTRMSALRERRKAAGRKQVTVWLDSAALDALERLRTDLGGISRDEAVAKVLATPAAGQTPQGAEQAIQAAGSDQTGADTTEARAAYQEACQRLAESELTVIAVDDALELLADIGQALGEVSPDRVAKSKAPTAEALAKKLAKAETLAGKHQSRAEKLDQEVHRLKAELKAERSLRKGLAKDLAEAQTPHPPQTQEKKTMKRPHDPRAAAELQAAIDEGLPLVVAISEGTSYHIRYAAEVFILANGIAFCDAGWSAPANPGHPFHVLEGDIRSRGENNWHIGPHHIRELRPREDTNAALSHEIWTRYRQSPEGKSATREAAWQSVAIFFRGLAKLRRIY